jgi:hypothetical protein
MTTPSRIASLLLAVAALSAATDAPGPTSIRYEVTALKGKLQWVLASGRQRLAVGAELASGDVIRTGWFSEATVTAPERAADFVLGARTRVRLAREVPGALIEVEHGRLHAIFHPFSGAEEDAAAGADDRIVTTPSLILAVRGTDYGVDVGRDGHTTVAVFSGAVATINRERTDEGVLLEAGQACTFSQGRPTGPPWRHGMASADWDRGRTPAREMPPGRRPGMDGDRPSSMGGQDDMGGTGAGGGGQRGGSGRHGG